MAHWDSNCDRLLSAWTSHQHQAENIIYLRCLLSHSLQQDSSPQYMLSPGSVICPIYDSKFTNKFWIKRRIEILRLNREVCGEMREEICSGSSPPWNWSHKKKVGIKCLNIFVCGVLVQMKCYFHSWCESYYNSPQLKGGEVINWTCWIVNIFCPTVLHRHKYI